VTPSSLEQVKVLPLEASGERAEPPLVLVHIPRTAGTTLAMILRHHYSGRAFHGGGNAFAGSEEIESRLGRIAAKSYVRAVSGHMTFGLADRHLPGARCIAILRDPVERTLSHHRVLVLPRSTPGSAVAGQRRKGLVPAGLPPAPPGLTIEEALAEGGYIPDNLQTRMLCGILSPYSELPADALERAKQNLRERFAFVGTTERFDELLALLNLTLGWPTIAYKRSRVRPGRDTRRELSPGTLALIEERAALDRELHDYATELLADAVDRCGAELAAELVVVREAARRWSERPKAPEPAEMRSLAYEARVALALKEAELARTAKQVRRLKRSSNPLERTQRQPQA
jgi:hypothetical protein